MLLKNSAKANNTYIYFLSSIEHIEINGKDIVSNKLYLDNLIVDNKPTLLKIKITPNSSVSPIPSSFYYGYNANDGTINFNIIVYPFNYPTFYNYIDYNNVVDNPDYNRDLKIHIDGSLVNKDNISILENHDKRGLLIQMCKLEKPEGWGWKNYQNQDMSKIFNKKLFSTFDNYISNPHSYSSLDKEEAYTEGLVFLLVRPFLNKNIVINLKFNLNDSQFKPSDIYNNFNGKNPNFLFYQQIVFLGQNKI